MIAMANNQETTMSETDLKVPENITFENAIALSQDLIIKLENEAINATQLQSLIKDLVATSNGARGFFVSYLTADSPVADQPSKAILEGLKSAPEIVSELLVKNIAMSTAMAITHRRQDHESIDRKSVV